MPESREILILACPRSGTLFTARYLEMMGYDVGHERIRSDGAIGWVYVIPGKIYNPLNSNREAFEWKNIAHQTRNPFDCIPSMLTHQDHLWEWVTRATGLDFGDNPLVRAMTFWYFWNELIEEQTEVQFQVETLRENGEGETLLRCMLPDREGVGDHNRVCRKTNTRNHPPVSPQSMAEASAEMFRRICSKADQYGYEVP